MEETKEVVQLGHCPATRLIIDEVEHRFSSIRTSLRVPSALANVETVTRPEALPVKRKAIHLQDGFLGSTTDGFVCQIRQGYAFSDRFVLPTTATEAFPRWRTKPHSVVHPGWGVDFGHQHSRRVSSRPGEQVCLEVSPIPSLQ